MKKHGLVYSMVALLAVLLPACTADDDLAPAVKPAEGLTITLKLPRSCRELLPNPAVIS